MWFSRDEGSGSDVITHTEYDDLGRVTKERNYNEWFATAAPKVEQRYEYEQFVASDWQHSFQTYSQYSMDGPVPELIGTTKTFIDPMGRVARIEDTPTGEATKKVEYYYDQASRVIDVVRFVPGGFFFHTAYDYDQAGRLEGIHHDLTTDIVHGYAYDRANRVTDFNTTHGTAYEGRDYGYDDAGQMTDYAGGGVTSGGGDYEFLYGFEYDANGNPTAAEGQTVLTGEHNRVTDDGFYTYSYDKEGNLKERIKKSNLADRFYYKYDHRNRLVQVKNVVGEHEVLIVDYQYNADGEMVFKRTDRPFESGMVEEHFVRDGGQVVLSFDDAHALNHRYLHSQATGEVLADEVFDGLGNVDELLWQVNDHQGTVRDIVDDAGILRKHVDYDAQGKVLNELWFTETGQAISKSHAEAVDQLFSYTGLMRDEATKLLHSATRVYDPELARWISEDIIQAPNLYTYSYNSWPNYIDPSGLTPQKPLDIMFGGYGSGIINAAPKPINLNTNLLSSPTLNYNSMSSAWGPIKTSTPSFVFRPSASDPSFFVGPSFSKAQPLTSSQKFEAHVSNLRSDYTAKSRARMSEVYNYRPQSLSGPGLDQIVDFAFAQVGNASRAIGNGLGSGIEYATSGYSGRLGNFVAGVGGGAAQLARTAGNIGAILDVPRTVQASIDDIGTTIDVGRQYGLLTAGARQFGLLQGTEMYYGTDVLTFQAVDRVSKASEAFGRFGATAAVVAGPASFLPQPVIGSARRQAIRSALSNSNGNLLTSAERQGIKFTIREVEQLGYRLDGGIRYNGNQGIDLAFTGTGSNSGRFALAEAKAGASRSTLTRDAAGIRQGSRDFFVSRLERAGRYDLRDALLIDGTVDLYGGFARSQRLFQFNPDVFQTDVNFLTTPNAAIRLK